VSIEKGVVIGTPASIPLRAGLVMAVGRALVIAAVGVVVGLGANLVRPGPIGLRGYEPPTTCSAGVPEGRVSLLSPTEVSALCGQSGVVVVDVRSPDKYTLGHVAGAIHLPCTASNEAAGVADSLLEGKRTIVVYGETNEDALPVAESLVARRGNQHLEAKVLSGGFAAWFNQGLACSSGPCDACDLRSTIPTSTGKSQ
jgi:rhodanese-related sulfurtransferase